jgi:S-(hydroxymethyl)glutathione dehydrogenase/alcohol dehydrogenase
MNFTGAVLVNINRPLQFIENIQVPKLKPGQVLVKVSYAGVCHSQLMEQSGQRGEDKYLPHLLGHEGTGIVVDIGPGVTKLVEGDRIVLGWLKGEGLDAGGTVYDSPIGKINSGAVTTFSEYTVVSENRCYPLPINISMQEGVLLGCALPTGMGIVKNQVKPKAEDILGFVGLGGIGMSALIAATCLPHKLLIAIDTNEDKLALAKQLGADVCLNPKQQNILTEVAKITNGSMLTFAVEAAGSCKTIELAFALINSQQGQCIFASHPPAGHKIQIDPFELICGKTISGSWGGCSHPEHMASFVSSNKAKINFDSFMSNIFPFKDINTAMTNLSDQKVLRAIVKVNS